MLKLLFILILILLSVPSGYLLAYLCRDELIAGRKYFKLLTFISSLLAVIFLFLNLTISLTLLVISILSSISLIKSYDKKFVKN